jgi:hypothetical protein
VNEFEWEEEEQEEEDRIGDVVSSDSDDSDDDQGGRDDMPTPVDAMPVPVHAMPAQGRLVTDLPEDDTPMIHGVELAKHNSTFHHHLTQ